MLILQHSEIISCFAFLLLLRATYIWNGLSFFFYSQYDPKERVEKKAESIKQIEIWNAWLTFQDFVAVRDNNIE